LMAVSARDATDAANSARIASTGKRFLIRKRNRQPRQSAIKPYFRDRRHSHGGRCRRESGGSRRVVALIYLAIVASRRAAAFATGSVCHECSRASLRLRSASRRPAPLRLPHAYNSHCSRLRGGLVQRCLSAAIAAAAAFNVGRAADKRYSVRAHRQCRGSTLVVVGWPSL
jgi:hypothetical protein